MDIKNTVSVIGEGVQVASNVKSGIENKIQQSEVKDFAKILEKKRIDVREESTLEFPKKNVEKAVSDVNQFFQAEHRKLSFSVNEVTKNIVIEVKDAETNEVLRQIPPEYVVRLAEQLNELSSEPHGSSGFLLQDKA